SKVSQAPLKREWVDLSELAAAIIEELRLAQPERQVQAELASGLRAFGDPKLLRCLLHNLLGNAWKYTGKTEGARIEFGAMDTGGTRTFYVRDNGVGFDMACAGELFRAFQRLHHPSEFEGTGIGLATVHRIVARHGGKVWAEAQEGEGATFFFTLH
ncbi:MAG: ATP-binding protein, partial [Thiohalomonadaceae bacterium]